ncbi:MAG: thioesterase family protein [Gammaproteobacteria bacterium]
MNHESNLSGKEVHREIIRVRWGDLDAMGHVNNSVFLTYFEQTRVAWLQQIDWSAADDGTGPVVVKVVCNYHRPINYPAGLEVILAIDSPGRSSLPTYYEIRDIDDPECLYATGEAVMVWVDGRSGRSAPLPASLRDLAAG